jgi:hypothetical protein
VQGNQGNPFTYGNPISDPSRFFGRVREAEQIFGRLRNPEFESSSVVGERRIGKTSLLNYIADPAVRAAHGLGGDNYIFVYIDLLMVGERMGPEDLWRWLLDHLLKQCRDDVIAKALKELLRRKQLVTFDLNSFFQQTDARGQHIVFLLDEFEHVTANPNIGPDFYSGFRSLASHRKVALATSSRLDLIELCHSESVRSSPFFNIFANVNLRMFSQSEVESLISKSLDQTGIRFTDGDTKQVLDLAGRHPHFVQVACHLLYEAYDRKLGAQALKDFLAERFRAEAIQQFEYFWKNSSDPHKIVLTAAALLEHRDGQPEFTMRKLRPLYSLAEQNTAALERRGLVMRTDSNDGYRLFSSALGPWVIDQIAELDDRQSFPDWLDRNKDAHSQVGSWRKRRLKKVLAKVGPDYRRLILAWASDPQVVTAVIRLLMSTLGMGS